jgi:hypothetical protein
MSPSELSGPDLDGVVADAKAVGLPHVVIGGFAVIAHGYLRATKDSVPDGPEADEAIVRFLDRGQDRLDLENLERVNGELPIDPIPGLDT